MFNAQFLIYKGAKKITTPFFLFGKDSSHYLSIIKYLEENGIRKISEFFQDYQIRSKIIRFAARLSDWQLDYQIRS